MRWMLNLLLPLVAIASPLSAQGPAPTPLAKAPPATPVPAPAAAGQKSLDAADVSAWIDGFLPYALERGHIPGAVVVVVRDGQILLQRGYGFADVAARKPVLPEATLFRPGSVSKLFTWTAVMQQVEAGKLDLDKDVNAYIDFRIPPFEGKPITLRNIMTHTSGFEESVRYLISSDPKAVKTLKRLMPLALPERVFAPGTTPAYSNYATALAGYIVERVSGEPFDDYIERHIFAPLGMRHASFRQPLPPALARDMAEGYPELGQRAKPFEIVVPAPAGSLSASGADMGRFMIAHLNDGAGLLRPETARMMHNFRAAGIGPLNRMALGFYEQQVNGHRAIAHGGDTDHFHSYLWLFPDSRTGLFISMNSEGKEGAAQAVRSALFHKFADRYLPGNEQFGRVDAKTARDHVALMAGHYVSSRGSFTNFMSLLGLLGQAEVVATDDGQLSVPALDGLSAGPRDWVEVAPFVWRDRNTGERLAADVKDGRVIRFSLDAASPFVVFTPAPFATNTAWLMPALLVALVIALIVALAWPIRALTRRYYHATSKLEGRALQAWRTSRAFAWLVLLATVGWFVLITTFSADIGSVGGPLDPLIQGLRLLTPIAALGLLGASAWHLWLSVRGKQHWTMIVGAMALLLSAMVVAWVTLVYRLFGFGLVY